MANIKTGDIFFSYINKNTFDDNIKYGINVFFMIKFSSLKECLLNFIKCKKTLNDFYILECLKTEFGQELIKNLDKEEYVNIYNKLIVLS